MSRIASFNLFKCLDCGQIHTRPEWGTYRVGFPPNDWGTRSDILKTCVSCGLKKPIFEYLHVARTSGSGDHRDIIWLVESAAPRKKKQTILDLLLSPFKSKERTLANYPSFNDWTHHKHVKRLTCTYQIFTKFDKVLIGAWRTVVMGKRKALADLGGWGYGGV